MANGWKSTRRNLQAKLRRARLGAAGRARLQQVLDCLTPHGCAVPLTRIGGGADGGYLLPDDLDGIAASFSPGVSDKMDFDLAILERGIPCFLADASVPGLPHPHPLATFDRLFLGPRTEGQFISLDDWVARYAPARGDLLLQMDIEGAEYATLAAASDATLARFRILLVEFHGFHRILSPKHLERMAPVLDRLARTHAVVHLHPNNAAPPVRAGDLSLPPVFEAAFLRLDRAGELTEPPALPHPLDQPNIASLPDYPMPRFWSGG